MLAYDVDSALFNGEGDNAVASADCLERVVCTDTWRELDSFDVWFAYDVDTALSNDEDDNAVASANFLE